MFDPFLDAPVYGAAAIAKILNLLDESGAPDARRAFYGLEKGFYDADKVGRQWVSTPRRLLKPHLAHLTAA
jgi:hypothetical protein